MRRVVLDTRSTYGRLQGKNCLLQALPSRSPYHKIWTEVLAGRISLCVNTEILNEYEEILAEKTTAEIAHNVVEAIARLDTTEFQTPTTISLLTAPWPPMPSTSSPTTPTLTSSSR